MLIIKRYGPDHTLSHNTSMKLRVMSDLHIEFGKLTVPVLPNEGGTVCILAGDIGVAIRPDTYVPFVKKMAKRFSDVIYVLGNHEYYRGDYDTTFIAIKNKLGQLTNVTVVGDEIATFVYEKEKVTIISTTLWTDMDNRNPLTMLAAVRGMNDYHVITRMGGKLTPEDTIAIHERVVGKLFEEIKYWKNMGWKVVVVTHHAPSCLSTAMEYKDDVLNGAFRSNLEYKILDTNPNLWIHGHIHNSSDYMLDQTRVICNPRGYIVLDPNERFDSRLTIDI